MNVWGPCHDSREGATTVPFEDDNDDEDYNDNDDDDDGDDGDDDDDDDDDGDDGDDDDDDDDYFCSSTLGSLNPPFHDRLL